MKKIAVFHQFLDNIGGAEIVTLTLARELDTDIYTTNISEKKISALGFSDVLPRIYSIGKIPVNPPYRHQVALWRFSRLNLKNKYDTFIISGDWAISGSKHNKPNLWYAHSPCRELYDLRTYVRTNLVPWWQRPAFDVWVTVNRFIHARYLTHINTLACNSSNTKARVKKYLGRDAPVIYPPIDIKKYHWKPHKNYWLSVNRLLPHKRIETQIEAFRKLRDEKLIIVGSYEKNARQFEMYKKQLEKNLPSNIEIKHWVTDEELRELYAECKGFITTAKDEDFGMTIVEAFASGKPVIAPNEGGYKETVTHSENGLLVDSVEPSEVSNAIKQLNEIILSNEKRWLIINQNKAEKFSTRNFIEQIEKQLCQASFNK